MPRTYTQLYYHLVWATKLRLPFLEPAVRGDLYPFIGGVVRDLGGVMVAIGGMPDHVHLLAGLRAQPSLARIVKTIKGSSSHWLNSSRPTADRFAWQEGYAGFTVSRSALAAVRSYIEHQEAHHQKMSFQQEMVRLLEAHAVEFRAADL